MEDNVKIKIRNRSNNVVGYTIPDMGNLHRRFEKRQEKIITFEELRKLSYISGGIQILKNYLIVRDPQALKELQIDVEPEYYYEEDQVKKLLQEGSLDEFLDCLDFAPQGVLDMIKTLAVNLPVNDVAKRRAILDKLKFNVDKAIEIKQMAEEDEQVPEAAISKRRVQINDKNGEQPTRRVVKILTEA